jgi:hypothetical protein
MTEQANDWIEFSHLSFFSDLSLFPIPLAPTSLDEGCKSYGNSRYLGAMLLGRLQQVSLTREERQNWLGRVTRGAVGSCHDDIIGDWNGTHTMETIADSQTS